MRGAPQAPPSPDVPGVFQSCGKQTEGKNMIPLIMVMLSVAEAPTPVYVLEHPGIAFGWLPAELSSPAEGVITVESGTVASNPGPDGYDYRIHYWAVDGDMNPVERGLWLRRKLESVLPPDLAGGIIYGSMNWVEGSTAVISAGVRPLGLASSLNFNLLSGADVHFRGRAYGVFRDGYAVLIYGMAPNSAVPGIGDVMEFIMANAWMLSGS